MNYLRKCLDIGLGVALVGVSVLVKRHKGGS